MSIIKVEHKTDCDLLEIGRKIGESFAAEKSGVVTILPKNHIVKTFQINDRVLLQARGTLSNLRK